MAQVNSVIFLAMKKIYLLIFLLSLLSCTKSNVSYGGKPKLSQPSIKDWVKIKKGDTYEKVLSVLGKEKYMLGFDTNESGYLTSYIYGHITFDNILVDNVVFQLDFDEGVVYDITPFLDSEQKIDEQKINFATNISLNFLYIDLRWKPLICDSSIVYEVVYEFEMSDEWVRRVYFSNIPYYPLRLVGINEARIKVRGVSKSGKSRWFNWIIYKNGKINTQEHNDTGSTSLCD